MKDLKRNGMVVQRTHSQTMGLFQPFRIGKEVKYRVVAVCHVRNDQTINDWLRRGAIRNFVTWDWKKP